MINFCMPYLLYCQHLAGNQRVYWLPNKQDRSFLFVEIQTVFKIRINLTHIQPPAADGFPFMSCGFIIVPDMLKNAPMFKRIDPKSKVSICLAPGADAAAKSTSRFLHRLNQMGSTLSFNLLPRVTCFAVQTTFVPSNWQADLLRGVSR